MMDDEQQTAEVTKWDKTIYLICGLYVNLYLFACKCLGLKRKRVIAEKIIKPVLQQRSDSVIIVRTPG